MHSTEKTSATSSSAGWRCCLLIEATPENAAAARRAVQLWGGFETFFVSLEDLIAMKTVTGRPEKDLPDLERLRLLRERKGRNAPQRIEIPDQADRARRTIVGTTEASHCQTCRTAQPMRTLA